jgi:hypothetical protein
MKKLIMKIIPIVDLLFLLFIYPAAWLMKMIRKIGVHKLPLCKNALIVVGVFPIRSHYYEPQFDKWDLNPNFSKDRYLKGINWNISGQLETLKSLTYYRELADIPAEKQAPKTFFLNNGNFESGDAEFWYQIIRRIKPQRILEVGSGYSTLVAIDAIRKNRLEDSLYKCSHICIEPFEMNWLEDLEISVLRKKVEDVELSFFSQLEENDILFIDSSHVIRPQGDVLYELLELLPTLNKGVIVHFHDIFSPKNYPKDWLQNEVRFWNEQYLLEAFLSHNCDWSIIGALNYLHHNHYVELKSVAPFLTPEREPGSFYIQKTTT